MSGFLEQMCSDKGTKYRHTKFSRSYLLENPGPGHRFLALYDEWAKPMHNFDEYITEKGLFQEPADPVCNPHTSYYRQDGSSVWAIMEKHPERLHNFQSSMSVYNAIIPITGYFDFGRFRNTREEAAACRAQVVDVGGGSGIVLKQILDACSDIDPSACVLEDLAQVIQLSKSHNLLPESVRRLEHDFMQEQPVKGAKAYILRMVLHDYADPVSERILRSISTAMAPDSRILIYEMILPSRITEHDLQLLVVDFAVLGMSGKERTKEGFVRLLDVAGLEIVEVWRQPGVLGACIEARLRRR